jgi:hypothetical protein
VSDFSVRFDRKRPWILGVEQEASKGFDDFDKSYFDQVYRMDGGVLTKVRLLPHPLVLLRWAIGGGLFMRYGPGLMVAEDQA